MKNKAFYALTKITLITATSFLLLACGGGSGSSTATTGILNLAITDAPVDDAKSVFVEFTGVELQGPSGRVSHDFVDDSGTPVARQINLLDLTDGAVDVLLDGITLDAGNYNWMRLKVNAERGVMDSYIELNDDSRFSLYVPSGNQSGLKLNRGFVVPAGGEASFVIDFDLRKSVHKPNGSFDDYILRPTLRLIDQNNVGKLSGTIASTLIDGECTPAVYVFNTADAVDDIDGTDDAIVTTTAKLKDDGSAKYSVAFLAEGDYKIAYTCDSANDDPETDDAAELVSFTGETSVTIEKNKTTNSNFD